MKSWQKPCRICGAACQGNYCGQHRQTKEISRKALATKIANGTNVGWAKGKTKENSPGLMRISEKMKKSHANGSRNEMYKKMGNTKSLAILAGTSKIPGRGKVGHRQDLINQFFRSTWEANIARIFNLFNAKFEHEKHRFLINGKWYHPDFKIMNTFFEIKGYMKPGDQAKVDGFREAHPEFKFIVIGPAEYANLEKRYKDLIPAWEGRSMLKKLINYGIL